MEQILLGAFETYTSQIHTAITEEINNIQYSKFLNVTELKDGSISIKAKNIIVAKVKLQRGTPCVEIRVKNAELFPAEIIETLNDEWCRIKVDGIESVLKLKTQLSSLFMIILSEMGGESFGCCHRYEQCSNEKRCIHPDFMVALTCSYRKNLEAGRIFYGENKTI